MDTIVINTDKNKFVGRFADLASAEAATAGARYNAYFLNEPSQLEQFTIVQLAEIYNSTQPKEKHVQKFSSKGVGLDRTWSAINKAVAAPVRVAKSQSTQRCEYDEQAKIKILVEANPRKKKTGNGYRAWELYKDGMLVVDYLNAREKRDDIGGGLNDHLYYDVLKGYIEIVQ